MMKPGTPCFECGAEAIFNHHVIPKSQGGKNTVPLCATCHGIVHSRTFTVNYREIIKQAMARAKAHGVQCGHKPALTPAQAQDLRQLRAAGVSIAALCQRFALGRTALYRYLAQGRQDDTQAAAAD